MSAVKRSWVATGRSNMWEPNGKEGKRFSTREQAIEFAYSMAEYGWWDVCVWWIPVIPDKKNPPKIVWRYVKV